MTTSQIEPLTDLFNAIEQLKTAGHIEAALARYRVWLAQAANSPTAYAVWFNLGVELASLKRPHDAIAAYRQAIDIKADFVPARFNLGTQLEQLGQPQLALTQWRDILAQQQPALLADLSLHTLTLNNLGRLLEIEREYPEAEAMLAQSLTLDSNQPKALQHWLHLRQKQCAWPLCAELPGVSPAQMIAAASALSTLALTDDPAQQLAVAQRFVTEKVKPLTEPLAPVGGYGHRKLRIGYLSSDFCLHPVALLTVELFELHDREQFTVHGFCWTRDDGSLLRRRIIAAMDQFTQIGDVDDEAAAQCIRAQEIDILIDLQGLTSGARPNILVQRPAPVQISYLGFPGTSGHPALDYLLGDDYLLPESEQVHYSERPLRMPRCFQVSDCQREEAAPLQRATYQLPDDVIVFCCFNNTYKITPDVFTVWMRILQRVPDSVLWLLADNPQVPLNLTREATQHGVDPARLRFAGRVAPSVYLARYALADLFLDTFPFNAGTTANDALWMGLPVLTYSGRAFASRMAGSLLHAAGFDTLITTNLHDYEEKAVSFAQSPEQRLALRQQVAALRQQDLFDMPTRTREVETLYRLALRERLGADALPEITPDVTTSERQFLRVFCASQHQTDTLPIFQREQWRELQCHLNAASTDILSTINNITDATVDAVYINHALEHLFFHDAARLLTAARRVLKADGFIVVVCADLQAICGLIAANRATEPLYQSTAGAITALDLLFGHQAAIAAGDTGMAQRSGFTRDSLAAALTTAGYGRVGVISRPEHFDLWAFATKRLLAADDFAALSQTVLMA
ncbi:methyltransferase domain-containing protein [Chromatium okenii]|uniref:O-linked N-acetylglucosamine transferase family protein n=1 Tax=Chromatium okenii TaxID=61644 RepID=UPI0026F233DD|nr:methyltransferase domain-containing protein [Chromatium okenii]MBV5310944.1 methyltransferase domain-containing protein [Chromatium okenii]